MTRTPIPAVVAAAGQTRERALDVRPLLAKGGDPYHVIMKTVQALAAGEALHLIVDFEPSQLYELMRSVGRSAHTEERDGAYHVWFFRDPRHPEDSAGASHRAELQSPVELDVRGLESLQSTVVILEKLASLGPGAQLLVHHHHEPVALYEKLKLRGYDARTQCLSEGDFLVFVAPSWAFEDAAPAPG